ncbi:Homeodomain protein [Pseudocohnilembus persalinus]|uniref:Homeodomain protein n=1 Tax=Pseudocohnilembus persalinus TaxID=266149 RepID=A0A0V0QMT0_PSEPJ|nr:Homeodomain protein [Pseudocohnilembus persalinus]|eukprot:KRX03542.1 Homeodomain protein [Pseudocohnilembus persalinus]
MQKDKVTNGRWTDEEHSLFLKGLQMHGKNWKLIEKMIQTRTGSQIRSHAQKYYLKLGKPSKKQKEKKSSAKLSADDFEIKLEELQEQSKTQKKLIEKTSKKMNMYKQMPPTPYIPYGPINIDGQIQYQPYPVYPGSIPQEAFLPIHQQHYLEIQKQQQANQIGKPELLTNSQQQPNLYMQQFSKENYAIPQMKYGQIPQFMLQQGLQYQRPDLFMNQNMDTRKYSENLDQFSTTTDDVPSSQQIEFAKKQQQMYQIPFPFQNIPQMQQQNIASRKQELIGFIGLLLLFVCLVMCKGYVDPSNHDELTPFNKSYENYKSHVVRDYICTNKQYILYGLSGLFISMVFKRILERYQKKAQKKQEKQKEQKEKQGNCSLWVLQFMTWLKQQGRGGGGG